MSDNFVYIKTGSMHLSYFKTWMFTIIITLSGNCGNVQPESPTYKLIGGPCEGCEAIFEFKDSALSPIDTLLGYFDNDEKLKISGTVFQNDGKTPAEDVILYVYHTNEQGIYENKFHHQNWEQNHGYMRGWMKTDAHGYYVFYTSKPTPYPNRSDPAHIHLTILEPDGRYYWAASYEFDGDPLLKSELYLEKDKRAGSGVISLTRENNIWIGKRDIILGRNIDDY